MKKTSVLARPWRINSNDLQMFQQKHCQQQALPKDLGMGCSTVFELDKDLTYTQTLYEPCKDLIVLSQMECQEPYLVVTLGLRGYSSFTSNRGKKLEFNEGYTSITSIQSSRGERHYQAHKPTTQLRFTLNKNWLDRYFGEEKATMLFNCDDTQLLSYQPSTPQAIYAAKQLLNANVSKETHKLFIHGQAMSLLAFELNNLGKNQNPKVTRFNHRDSMIAQLARDILLQDYKNPPSVEALSQRVGTNPFKLKKIFHDFFNNTPYGLLLEIRMNAAYQLLETTPCQVGVVADKVGYQHPGNFSSAFIKYFGVSPKAVSKNHVKP